MLMQQLDKDITKGKTSAAKLQLQAMDQNLQAKEMVAIAILVRARLLYVATQEGEEEAKQGYDAFWSLEECDSKAFYTFFLNAWPFLKLSLENTVKLSSSLALEALQTSKSKLVELERPGVTLMPLNEEYQEMRIEALDWIQINLLQALYLEGKVEEVLSHTQPASFDRAGWNALIQAMAVIKWKPEGNSASELLIYSCKHLNSFGCSLLLGRSDDLSQEEQYYWWSFQQGLEASEWTLWLAQEELNSMGANENSFSEESFQDLDKERIKNEAMKILQESLEVREEEESYREEMQEYLKEQFLKNQKN